MPPPSGAARDGGIDVSFDLDDMDEDDQLFDALHGGNPLDEVLQGSDSDFFQTR